MKLRLPKVLFAAVLACAAQAFATDYVYGTNDNNVASKLTAPTADDTITFQKESGYLTQGGGTINAHVVVDQLKLTNGYSNVTYTFKNDVSGTGEFTIASDGTWNSNTFVFEGDMSSYSGAMTIANNKPVTLTFQNSTGTGAISATNGNGKVNLDTATLNASSVSTGTINVTGGESTVAATSALTFTNLNIADGSSLSVAEGKTLTLNGTVNVTTSNGEVINPEAGTNGFQTINLTDVVIFSGAGTTDWSNATVKINGTEVELTSGTYNGNTKKYIVGAEGAAEINSDVLNETSVVAVNAAASLNVSGGTLAFEDITVNEGGSITALSIGDGGKLTVVGDNNSAGFTTAPLSVTAGGTLELGGHDALGYNNGEGKGSATPLIEMQGAEGNKAVLDNQDTSGGNPANLTFTTDLTLKGHTEVKGNNIKVFGAKVTATGTDNTIATNLILDKAMTVEVTGSGDTLTISGNVSGGNAMTKTGEGALTISGAIANNVQLNNSGAAGSMVLDSVTLNGRLNIYNSTGTTMAGGVTSNVADDNYALVVGTTTQGTSSTVTLTEGTYNLGAAHVGIGTYGTLVVDKDASLTAKDISNSGNLANNGALTIKAEDESKGSVTASGTVNLGTLNNEGKATFNGAYNGTNVNLKDGSSTAFNAAATITNLTVAGDADLTIGGTTTVTTGAQVALNTLTMKGGSLTIGSTSHEDSVVTVKTLNVDGDSTLNANLVIAEGAAVDMKGSVTLGCTVTISAGTVLNVEGDVSVAPVAIFTDVEGLTLGTTAIENMGWYDANGILASVNGTAVTDAGQYVIGFWNGTVSVAEASVPEPATATLSLLALAALAARRKRK